MSEQRGEPTAKAGIEAHESPKKGMSLVSLISLMLLSWRNRLVFVASSTGYWVLYAFSVGMMSYYSSDLAPFLGSDGFSSRYFVSYPQSFYCLYDSGIIWVPTNHLQLELLYGPSLYSPIFPLRTQHAAVRLQL